MVVTHPNFDDKIKMRTLTLLYDLVASDEEIFKDDPKYVRHMVGDEMMLVSQLWELLENISGDDNFFE